VSVRVTVDISDPDHELARLEAGPGAGHATMSLEGILARSFAATQFQVHVLSGGLKASGHPESEYDGAVWSGTLVYARHPGIFELARGDSPTANHPEGGHFFFDAAHRFNAEYKQAVADWLEG
jgi:hypothetical protein